MSLKAPHPIDLQAKTDTELKVLLANRDKHGDIEGVREVIVELDRRGQFSTAQWRHVEWNPIKVKAVLQPFIDISANVNGNTRTTYSESGGRKIGLRSDNPDKLWIDSYTAICTASINAYMACHIGKVGEQPIFELKVEPDTVMQFDFVQLDEAEMHWREVASRANPSA